MAIKRRCCDPWRRPRQAGAIHVSVHPPYSGFIYAFSSSANLRAELALLDAPITNSAILRGQMALPRVGRYAARWHPLDGKATFQSEALAAGDDPGDRESQPT